ncbi:MFS transporter [uncultured Amnibacterium sp.]|uniref:MFS transporter n=1 Tax=uncultured Amnibacterium sp. TaxID=1631851 RepID=UPI0035CA9BBA
MSAGRSGRSGPSSNRTVFSLALLFATNGFLYASYIPRLPEIRDQTGISTTTLGLVLTVGNLAGLGASLLTGAAITRLGSRRILLVGCVFYALALPAVGWSTSALLLIAALVVMQLFDVFIDVAMNLQGSRTSTEREQPVMSRLHGAWSFGSLAGAGTASLAAAFDLSVAVHYSLVGALLILALLIAAPGLRRSDAPTTPPGQPLQSSESAARQDTPQDVARSGHGGRDGPAGRRYWLHPAVLGLAVASLATFAVDTSTGEWATFRLGDDLDVPAGAAAAAYVVFTLAMTIGRLFGDHATSRLGVLVTARTGTLTAVAGVLISMLIPSPVAAFIGIAVTGLGISVLSPQLADAAARTPGPPGSGFSALFVGQRLSGLLTPALVGVLAGSSVLTVGQAVALVAVPIAVVLLLVSRAAFPLR